MVWGWIRREDVFDVFEGKKLNLEYPSKLFHSRKKMSGSMNEMRIRPCGCGC